MTQRFGSISSGTMRSEDLLGVFADELETRAKEAAQHPGAINPDNMTLVNEARELLECETDLEDEEASTVVNDLIDALNEYAPQYGYFGAHPGDGADFGYWLHEDWQQMAKDDDVLFVDDLADVLEDYTGVLCVVNDHGNATLYDRRLDSRGEFEHREIWSVV